LFGVALVCLREYERAFARSSEDQWRDVSEHVIKLESALAQHLPRVERCEGAVDPVDVPLSPEKAPYLAGTRRMLHALAARLVALRRFTRRLYELQQALVLVHSKVNFQVDTVNPLASAPSIPAMTVDETLDLLDCLFVRIEEEIHSRRPDYQP